MEATRRGEAAGGGCEAVSLRVLTLVAAARRRTFLQVPFAVSLIAIVYNLPGALPYTLHPTPYTLHPTPRFLTPRRSAPAPVCRTLWAALTPQLRGLSP